MLVKTSWLFSVSMVPSKAAHASEGEPRQCPSRVFSIRSPTSLFPYVYVTVKGLTACERGSSSALVPSSAKASVGRRTSGSVSGSNSGV